MDQDRKKDELQQIRETLAELVKLQALTLHRLEKIDELLRERSS